MELAAAYFLILLSLIFVGAGAVLALLIGLRVYAVSQGCTAKRLAAC